jgi:hypothetical protein
MVFKMNDRRLNNIYISILIIGFLLPSIIASIVILLFEPADVVRLFVSSARTFILIGLFNVIPFAVYVKMLKSFMVRANDNISSKDQLRHKYGLIFAAIVGLNIIIYIQVTTWIGMIKLVPGASTAGIAFLLLPVYGLFAVVLGYGFGMLVAKVQAFISKNKA